MSTEYCAIPRGKGFVIKVKLSPQYGGAIHNQGLAVALLDVLNGANFKANVCNPASVDGSTSYAPVRFEEPVNQCEQRIVAEFYLAKPDPDEIRNVWDQAQRFLTNSMDQAVATFDVMLAVASVNPYKARLLQVTRNQA